MSEEKKGGCFSKGFGCLGVAIVFLFLIAVLYPTGDSPSSSSYSGSSYSSSSSSNYLDRAHEEYRKRDQGYRSSNLPRMGETKGDDYRNCVDMEYYRNEDPYDFCAWHAGIGKYQ
jgi:hypothetical protein